MIKLSYKVLNEGLPGALAELRENRFNAKTAYAISKICEKVEQAQKQGRDEYMSILKKHVELDEKGEIKKFGGEVALDPEGKPLLTPKGETMKSPDEPFRFKEGSKTLYDEELKKFLEESFLELPYQPLTLDQLGNAEITPECFEFLTPILALPN